LLRHLLSHRISPGSRASRSSYRVEGAATWRRRGAMNCRYLQAHRPEPDTLVGHSSQAGLALERAVFTSDSARARLPNELRPGTAGRGGFAFSGVTASAASFAVGGDVCETLGEGQGAPGSDMSVFARRSADFPPCFVTWTKVEFPGHTHFAVQVGHEIVSPKVRRVTRSPVISWGDGLTRLYLPRSVGWRDLRWSREAIASRDCISRGPSGHANSGGSPELCPWGGGARVLPLVVHQNILRGRS